MALPTGQILVIDDDPAVLTLLQRTIAPAGYQAVGVDSAEAGLEQLCDPRQAWVGCIVDATLPLMQHGRLLASIDELHPNLPIIVTSALDLRTARALVGRRLTIFLPKPFGIDAVLSALNTAGIPLSGVS